MGENWWKELLLVDSFLEDTGTLERDYFSGFQGDFPAGPGIPPFSRILFFYAEFAKPADEDILSVLQVLLGDLEERFNRLRERARPQAFKGKCLSAPQMR